MIGEAEPSYWVVRDIALSIPKRPSYAGSTRCSQIRRTLRPRSSAGRVQAKCSDGMFDSIFGFSQAVLFDVSTGNIIGQVDGGAFIASALFPSDRKIAI